MVNMTKFIHYPCIKKILQRTEVIKRIFFQWRWSGVAVLYHRDTATWM